LCHAPRTVAQCSPPRANTQKSVGERDISDRLLGAALLLWFLIRSWRSARQERYLWEKPVPLWRELGQKVLSSGAGFRKSVQTQRALPASAPKPLIEVRPLAKPGTTQQATSAAAAQTELPSPQTPAAKSNGFGSRSFSNRRLP
ncbi:MAG: hypothetical protein ABSA39_01090, partial [Edaphobacter sp.]